MTTSTTTLRPPRPTRRAASSAGADWRLRLAVLAAIWGSSFLLIKVAVADLAPAQIAFGRCAFGAAAVLVSVLVARQRPPRERRIWGHLFVSAALLNTVPFTLFGYAEQHVSSAVAGVMNGTAPLFTFAFAMVALADERPTRSRLGALAVGLVGVAVVVGVWRGTDADSVGVLMAMVASACYGAGWVYLRRFLRATPYSPLVLTGAQLGLATVQLAAVCAVVAPAAGRLHLPALAAVLALGVLGTGIAYVLQHGIIRDVGATSASTVTYLVPMVAVGLGIGIGQETLRWNVFVGAVLIVAAAAVANHATRRRRAA